MVPVAKAVIVLWENCVGMTKSSSQPSLLIGTLDVNCVTDLCGLCWKSHSFVITQSLTITHFNYAPRCPSEWG